MSPQGRENIFITLLMSVATLRFSSWAAVFFMASARQRRRKEEGWG
jgi:hypothetical protein